jgi:hypothetical protein
MNMSLPITDKNIVYPLIYNDKSYDDYGVHKITGHVYSRKLGEKWIQLSGHGKKYPSVSISNNGITSSILVHRAAACTILGYPETCPGSEHITDAMWARTPKLVKASYEELKKLFFENLQVNHIDGDRWNHSPSNLEFIMGKDNIKHYHESRKKAA